MAASSCFATRSSTTIDGRRHGLGARTARSARRRRAARRLSTHGLLAADGHPAGQGSSGAAVEHRRRALENLAMTPAQQAFWRDRHVLVTGHTGFKGSWLALMLQRLGAKVSGIALAPEASPSTFADLGPWPTLDHHTFDIRDAERLRDTLWSLKPQVVFHLAAQALGAPWLSTSTRNLFDEHPRND